MSDFNPRTTPWQIDEADFYEIEQRDEQYRFLLRYAVLAPSSHNTQPWSFKITADGIEVHAELERRVPIADPQNRELLMSLGAAIANLRVAAAHFGYEATVLYQPRQEESLPVALVALRETCAPDQNLARLFPAITRRRTNRHRFESRQVEESALSTICDFMDDHVNTLMFVVPHDRPRVADLVAQGDQILLRRPSFRQELADWVRPNESSALDGICGDAFGFPGPISALAPWLIRSLDISSTQSFHDRDLAEAAAGLLVVTAEDDSTSLVQAGEVLERLLLLLTTLGVDYSFLNQPIEVDDLRKALRSLLRADKPPQLMLRIGYGQPVTKAMPRRPVEMVIRKEG